MVWDIFLYMRQEFGWLSHFQHHTCRANWASANPIPQSIPTPAKVSTCFRPSTLFLDDKPENIAGAEQVGLHAIRFSSIEQLRKDLAARGLQQSLPVPGAAQEIQA